MTGTAAGKKGLTGKKNADVPLTATQKHLTALMKGKKRKVSRRKPKTKTKQTAPQQPKVSSQFAAAAPNAWNSMNTFGGLRSAPTFKEKAIVTNSKAKKKEIRVESRKHLFSSERPTKEMKSKGNVKHSENIPQNFTVSAATSSLPESRSKNTAIEPTRHKTALTLDASRKRKRQKPLERVPSNRDTLLSRGLLDSIEGTGDANTASDLRPVHHTRPPAETQAEDGEGSSESSPAKLARVQENENSDLVLPPPGKSSASHPLKVQKDSVQEKISAILQPMPRPQQQHQQQQGNTSLETKNKKSKSTGNFVRQNLRNSAGTCLGARNKKTKSKAQLKWEQRKKDRDEWYEKKQQGKTQSRKQRSDTAFVSRSGIDPVDDFLDGVYSGNPVSEKQRKGKSPIPTCSGHQLPCKKLVVKKAGPNKGRPFFCCSFPRGNQCDHFQWADDTIQAAKMALLKNSSQSGFVARQVASYLESIKDLTVPELSRLACRNGLTTKGKKADLIARLSIWCRDQIVSTLSPETAIEFNQKTSCTLVPGTKHINRSCEREDHGGEAAPMDMVHQTQNESACDMKQVDSIARSFDPASLDCTECLDDESTSSIELELVLDNDLSDEDTKTNSDDESESSNHDNSTDHADEKGLPTIHKALRMFGHDCFREGQEWCISRCIAKKRTLFVAPTGFGKSLCYSLPASIMPGVCIVVSPLLSLIQDQLRVMPPRVPAATLSGSATSAQMAATLDDVLRGRIKIVFVSPERLASASFRRLFRPCWVAEKGQYGRRFPEVSLLCIDEAHCVSQWAHNFRPSYLRLKSMVDMIRPESVLAMTATAGPTVIKDICSTLGIESEESEGTRVLSCNRDNIDVQFFMTKTHEERLNKLASILGSTAPSSKRQSRNDGILADGSVVVYVWRQLDAEAVAENIQAAGVDGGIVVYHGGMDAAARAKAQSKFMRGKVRICVATVAFGLGINKTDIRGVVHLQLPSSPEHHLQEIGRAGRDGRPATAIALVLEEEVLVRHSLAHSDLVAESQVRKVLTMLSDQVQLMQQLLGVDSANQPMCLGLALGRFSTICCVSPESIETIISLLEQRDVPLLTLEGVYYDHATVAPRRCLIGKLADSEPVVAAIVKCATCVETPAGYGGATSDATAPTEVSIDESYGSYTFSVAQCANLLGQDAEPRHVFAALRRLQDKGAIELTLDTSETGRALSMRLSVEGVKQLSTNSSESIDCLAQYAYDICRRTVQLSAQKVVDMHYMTKRMALAEDENAKRNTRLGEKQSNLALFQELVHRYFEADGKQGFVSSESSQNQPNFQKVDSKKALFQDVNVAISVVKDVFSGSFGSESLLFEPNQEDIADFRALVATKFLHGLTPSSNIPQRLLRSNPLFGQYQGTEFASLFQAVRQLV